MATPESYDAESIQVLEWPEAVRRRPGMYIGDTATAAAQHHMLLEVLGNAVDEQLPERGARQIRIATDGERITVEDDGRGISPEALEHVFTRVHGGNTLKRPHVHLRPMLYGTGVAVACALSSVFEVEVAHGGHAYAQRFVCGRATSPVQHLGTTTRHGTRVTFTPDASLVAQHPWDVTAIEQTCRELAALIPGLSLIVDDTEACYARGLVDHLHYLANDPWLIEPLHARDERDGVGVEIAIAFARDAGALRGFVNYCANADGTHLRGLAAGLRRAFAGRRRWSKRLARQLLAIVHVTLEHPRFGNPTRDWLVNPEVEHAVRELVVERLVAHFDQAPALLDAILLAAA